MKTGDGGMVTAAGKMVPSSLGKGSEKVRYLLAGHIAFCGWGLMHLVYFVPYILLSVFAVFHHQRNVCG